MSAREYHNYPPNFRISHMTVKDGRELMRQSGGGWTAFSAKVEYEGIGKGKEVDIRQWDRIGIWERRRA